MNLFKIIETGGLSMFPLVILSVISITLIIELTWFNLKYHFILNSLLKSNSSDMNDKFSNIILSKDILDKEHALNSFLSKFERKTSFLSVIASISPLVGLLGTVLGMIKIFHTVSIERPTNPLEALSGGISEALFATAGGLVVAIVSGFSYYLLISSLDSIEDKSNNCILKQKNI